VPFPTTPDAIQPSFGGGANDAFVARASDSGGPETPALTVNDVAITEGNSGTVDAVFTVSLSGPSSVPVTVIWRTANGTALASDYVGVAGSTLTFAPGETSKTIAIPVIGDSVDEANETFFVNLESATNATRSDAQGVGTIIDDDASLPAIRISDAAAAEGHLGARRFVFTATLSAPSSEPVTVAFATANGTATLANRDYRAASGVLTFAPGETSKTIVVFVVGDRRLEANETFFVNLSSATNATVADSQGRGTIRNDDGAGARRGLRAGINLGVQAFWFGETSGGLPEQLGLTRGAISEELFGRTGVKRFNGFDSSF
jgi:hypothetical protein